MKAENFISLYKMEEDICDDVIKFFNKSKNKHQKGVVGEGDIKEDLKDSVDIPVGGIDAMNNLLNPYFEELTFALEKYKKKYIYADKTQAAYRLSGCNLQKYKPGGGFKSWHYENNGLKGSESSKRHLVFMTYLNTCKSAGTKFFYQDKTYQCKKGNTLIWPAHWTHTHKGVLTNKLTKYIITGWYSYE